MTEALDTERDAHGDTAPGDDWGDEKDIGKGLWNYLIGLVLAGGLTIASFVMPVSGLVWPPAIPVALVAFAIAQMGVHLVFFLHLTTGPDNTNNTLALAFGVLIVFLILAGSLWIMANLNHNMLPMTKIMQMQR